MSKRLIVFWQLQTMFFSCILTGCFPNMESDIESRHRTIIFEESWSQTAAIKNLWCVAELRESCKREAKQGERVLSKNLTAIFKAAPECRNVNFIMLAADTPNALGKKLQSNSNFEYWKLRVDFHPRHTAQPWDLGTDRQTIAGGDIQHDAAYICEVIKHNGVPAVW